MTLRNLRNRSSRLTGFLNHRPLLGHRILASRTAAATQLIRHHCFWRSPHLAPTRAHRDTRLTSKWMIRPAWLNRYAASTGCLHLICPLNLRCETRTVTGRRIVKNDFQITPGVRSGRLPENWISVHPAGYGLLAAGADVAGGPTRIGSSVTFRSPAPLVLSSPRWYWSRQMNNWLAFTLWRRATTGTDTPGSSVSRTIRTFSSAGQRRRVRTPTASPSLTRTRACGLAGISRSLHAYRRRFHGLVV